MAVTRAMEVQSKEEQPSEEIERPSTYPPHHLYCKSVAGLVAALMVRDKRQIYVSMRSGHVTSSSFFPRFSMSAADFAVWQILSETPRRTGRAEA